MKNKGFLAGTLSYVLWGTLPLYWQLLKHVDSVFILGNRIVWSAVFAVVLLAFSGRLKGVMEAFRNRAAMKYLLPAALVITLNWGLYIWAVNNGHILDASLGYYMNPLIVALTSLVVFKERMTRLEIGASVLAAIGVTAATIQYGSFPWVAIGLALTFAVYGALKKLVHFDPITSIAVETAIVLPAAVVYLVAVGLTTNVSGVLDLPTVLLLMGAGVCTAAPLMLYARGLNEVPFLTMGFLQFISPTLALFCGLIAGETMSDGQLVSFLFIWAGLALFVISKVHESKKHMAIPAQTASEHNE